MKRFLIYSVAMTMASTQASATAAPKPSGSCPAPQGAAWPNQVEPAGAIRSNTKHKGDYLPAHNRQAQGGGSAGRAAADHAINTKGTGAAGRCASGNGSDCNDSTARGLVRGVAAGTTDVKQLPQLGVLTARTTTAMMLLRWLSPTRAAITGTLTSRAPKARSRCRRVQASTIQRRAAFRT